MQRRRDPSRKSDRLGLIVAPAAFFVFVVGSWQLGVWHSIFGFEEFTLPYPRAIGTAVVEDHQELTEALLATLKPAVIGYVLGAAVGCAGGVGLSMLRPSVARRAASALTGAQALPVLALAPLMSLYFGGGDTYRIAVVMILTIPSMSSYTYRGLTGVPTDAVDLMYALNSSHWQVVRHLRLPNSLPFVFTALRGAVVLALVGTVVSEILRGRSGLGFQIVLSLASFQTGAAWAAMLALSLLGVGWYGLIALIERQVVPWR